MTPPTVIDSPSLKVTSISPGVLNKVTLVAGEPVEVQVRVEDKDPGVNFRGLGMVGEGSPGGRN